MITRGIITYSDSNDIRVYVPILQGKVDEKYLTEVSFNERFQGLRAVSVLSTPGLTVTYKPGDVVLVGFQDNEMSSVVILGYLGSAITQDENKISLKVQNLEVTGELAASTNVKFGDNVLDFTALFNAINNPSPGIDIESILNTPT